MYLLLFWEKGEETLFQDFSVLSSCCELVILALEELQKNGGICRND